MASDSGKPPILFLKDYLRDDLSSCSSSGFKSLPRRPCCLQYRSSSSSSSSCAMKSALQKASEAVVNVIKSLQIPSPQRSPGSSLSQTRTCKANEGVLSRSFSRRLLRRKFWRRAASKGDSKPRTFVSAASSASASDNNTCVDTNFTCSSTAAEDSTNIEGSVTTTTTTTKTCSVTNSTREWPNGEKEQFSPVSVLDCPLFDDDGEEITSPFNSTPCSSLEGAKHKHMQKTRHFNQVASLKPVALEERMSRLELQRNEPIHNLVCGNVEEKARHLLNHVKRSSPSSNCLRIEEENMLFDFFKQSIGDIDNDVDNLMKRHLCKVAEDWIRGQHHEEQCLSWEAWEGRELYITEMDKFGSWRNSEGEVECVAVELEVEFFTCLVNELLLDLTTC